MARTKKTNKTNKNDEKYESNKRQKNHADIWKAMNICNSNNNENVDMWVSGTTIKNFMINDPLIDWLDRYYIELCCDNDKNIQIKLDNECGKMKVLFDNGIEFENLVFEDIKKHHKYVQIGFKREDVNYENYSKTIKSMTDGVPIIIQAVLFHKETKTKGMADLLVRSDYINKLFKNCQLTEEEENISGLNDNYHYRVVDIKWTTLHLCSDGKHIRNYDRMPAYKGQLAIYNNIVGSIQGYYPNKTYILGHSWKYEKCRIVYSGDSCFDLLGHIDYSDFDSDYIKRTIDGINWIRRMRNEGKQWTLYPPSVKELYPNMSNNNDAPWTNIKMEIARKTEELTCLWQVGPKNRNICHKNNIYKLSDEKLCSEKLGITSKIIGPVLDKIISVNNSKNSGKLIPFIINNNYMDWQTKTDHDYYVDFETVNGCFINSPGINNNKSESNIIFFIGVGYIENEIWKFRTFKINDLRLEEETKIIDEWMSFMNERSQNNAIKIFHWSNAEVSSLRLANLRNQNKWCDDINRLLWIDLYKIFTTEPIVVKGAYRFKLKDIAKNMYKHNMIHSTWNDHGITNGLYAMIDAINYYKTKENNETMKYMEEYNEIDCKVMWEMTDYLRNNHTF